MLKRVFKLYYDFEKEEKWLNEMSAKGFMLKAYLLGSYFFEEDKQGRYIYRIELLENMPSHKKSKEYIEFLQETGVEVISTHFRWIYFRKEASDGGFDLYSDIESRIRHYQKVGYLWLLLCFSQFCVASTTIHRGISILTNEGSPVSLLLGLGVGMFCLFFFSLFYKANRKIKDLKTEKQIRE